MWARETDFDSIIGQASALYSVPVWVIKATIAKESSFDPSKNRPESRGRMSRGLMQLLEATARDMGYTGPAGDDNTRSGGLYDPETSILYGTKYLARQRRRYPTSPWDVIYGAYNAGSVRFATEADGRTLVLVNGKPVLINEANIKGWRTAADYFRPGWRSLYGAAAPG